MLQRIITGAILILVLIAALTLGGWGFSIPFMACVTLSVYEIFKAFRVSGYEPVDWPVYAALAISLPLMTLQLGPVSILLPLAALPVLLITVAVLFRQQPKLTDLMTSLLPILSVLLPALCMLSFFRLESHTLELYCMIMSFGVPLMGDTCAYFIGVIYGRTKLCEPVSPKKTVEGSCAGLFGSILFAVVLHLILRDSMTIPIWHTAILGLFTGIAGQAGDLFASLIKRHCGVKDFGSVFPGHGGIMDRLDSVYWGTVVMYIYMILFLRLV